MRAAGVVRGLLAAMVVVALGATAGCAEVTDVTRAEGVVAVAVDEPTVAITPDYLDDVAVSRILPALTAGLTRVTTAGDVEMELAESIESDGAQVWRVTLVDGAQFSDGTAVTAESFVAAWARRALLSNDLPGRESFSAFRGYSADEDADLVETGALTVVDDLTFRIRLSRPDPELPLRLSSTAFLPRPDVAVDDPAEYAQTAVGAGPYMLDLDASREHDHLELTPNPHYTGARKARNAGVSLRFIGGADAAVGELLLGEIDVVDRVDRVSTAAELLGAGIREGVLPELRSVVIPSDDDRFLGADGELRRQALAMAIDRAPLVSNDGIAVTTPADDYLPPTMTGPTVTVPWSDRADDATAQSLWRSAQNQFAWSGTLVFAVVAGNDDARLAEQIAARWERLFLVETQVRRFANQAALDAALAGDGEDQDPLLALTIRTTTADSPSATQFLTDLITPNERSRALVEPLRIARAATDDAERDTAVRAVESRLAEQLAIIPIGSRSVSAGVSDSVVGVTHDWNGVLQLWRMRVKTVD